MHCHKALLILVASAAAAADFSGASALRYTAKAVAFGPRPPGSAANRKLQAYLRSELKMRPCRVIQDAFTTITPTGPIAMKNIIAQFPGKSGRAIAITGHYDTKVMPGLHFVGANDGGSSTGFLLELARVLSARPRKDDIYLVWFDGEEAIAAWSDTDGLYGSRHLASRWAADGTAARLKALINVDMIGDRDLGIHQELGSSAPLRELIWRTAADLGYQRHFLNYGGATEDDHMPFVRIGVNATDLIDFEYGPNNTWWHTEKDTIDKLSAGSFEVVGKVVLEVIRRLESEP
jgi:Zn-dependent M28 family amino/carboxypeptidase